MGTVAPGAPSGTHRLLARSEVPRMGTTPFSLSLFYVCELAPMDQANDASGCPLPNAVGPGARQARVDVEDSYRAGVLVN